MENLKYTQDTFKKYEAQRTRLNEWNDCCVRAIAVALDLPYEVAHKICKDKFGRVNRTGIHADEHFFKFKKVTNIQDYYWGKKVYKKHFGKEAYDKVDRFNVDYDGKGITVGRFIKENPTGTFLVTKTRHAFAIIDGKVYGNASDIDSMRSRIRTAYKVGE